jgi:hypothetical protein
LVNSSSTFRGIAEVLVFYHYVELLLLTVVAIIFLLM